MFCIKYITVHLCFFTEKTTLFQETWLNLTVTAAVIAKLQSDSIDKLQLFILLGLMSFLGAIFGCKRKMFFFSSSCLDYPLHKEFYVVILLWPLFVKIKFLKHLDETNHSIYLVNNLAINIANSGLIFRVITYYADFIWLNMERNRINPSLFSKIFHSGGDNCSLATHHRLHKQTHIST